MSLLMKALQTAAQNRESSGEKSHGQVVPPSAPDHALQPLQAEPEAAAWKVQPEAAPSPELAATVMRASEIPSGIGVYIRGHPVVLFGMVAALLLIGGGLYVYLAISKPGMFLTPTQPPAPAPIAAAPARQAKPEPQPRVAASPEIQGQQGERQTAPEPQPLVAGLPEIQKQQGQLAAPSPTRPQQRLQQLPPRAASQQKISITPAKTTPVVEPQLVNAYQALQQNRLDAAQELYQKMLLTEPNNAEALLGLAAIAEQQKQPDKAAQYYLKVLNVDPKNTIAQAGLLGIVGHADPQASEARLKQLLARAPSAFVYFTLGNLYAEQSQWPAAQAAYFRAFHLQPDNADYAFNLAVGLEHLNQPKLALKFYQQALQLAKNQGHANFELSLAQNRISKLSSLE
jgi:Flp pilus assembly protein TadD